MKKLVLLMTMLLIFTTIIPKAPLYALGIEEEKGSYLIEYVSDDAKIQGKEKIKKSGGNVKKEFRYLRAVSAELTKSTAETLRNDSEVILVEPDSKFKIESEEYPWGVESVNAPVVQATGLKGSGVKVAVLDTGISPHPDLKIAGGVSFVDDTTSYADSLGHGTHVAGILGGVENNEGIIGVSPGIELYSVKVINNEGVGNYSSVINAIEWCIDNNINIINMSFGSGEYSKILEKAIDTAYVKNILMFASAGNNGDVSDNTITYPSRYQNVVSVGAVDKDGIRASFSSVGPELELVAPGVNIFSAFNNGSYVEKSGTSMASPHAAGVAALLWSKDLTVNNEYIRGLLDCAAVNLGEQNLYGNGKVDAKKSIELYDEFMSIQKSIDSKLNIKPKKSKDTKTRQNEQGTVVQWADIAHESIVRQGLQIIGNDKGADASEFYNEFARQILLEYSNWPDKLVGGEAGWPLFAGHFYDPDTELNYAGESDPTAFTRFSEHAVNAKRLYLENEDKTEAFRELGKALHYVGDLNEPHHASNLTALNSNHSTFEDWVNQNINDYLISSIPLERYGKYSAQKYEDNSDYFHLIAQESAHEAKGHIADASFYIDPFKHPIQYYMKGGREENYSHWDTAARPSLDMAQNQVVAFLDKFMKEVKPTSSKVDLIFAIDTTGSMWDDIENVKNSATEIVNTLSNNNIDYRVSIVDYRDYPINPYGGSEDYPYNVMIPFSNNKSDIISAIQKLSIGWGNDYEESVYTALMKSINTEGIGSWRTDAEKSIIVMGDAPPHDPEPFTEYTASSIISAANGGSSSNSISAQGITPLEVSSQNKISIYSVVIGYDTVVTEKFTQLSSGTGGKVFHALTASDVISAIIKSIDEIVKPTNSAPDISGATASVSLLWPVDNKFKEINILNVTDPEGDPVTIEITSITQDEPLKANGNKLEDAYGLNSDKAFMRATRDGNGNGRVYQINFTATDSKGAESSGHVLVGVPHDEGKNTAPINDGQIYSSVVN